MNSMAKYRLRAFLRGRACTILCAGMAVLSMGHVLGQERSAQNTLPVASVASSSVSMLPITADITNSDIQRLNADSDQNNWRLNGRTYDNQRFSPLTQINKNNVKQLKP